MAGRYAGCGCLRKPGLREAYELSIVSLAAAAVAVVVGAVSADQSRSATALGYALENAVDFLGSLLVLWRFAGGGESVPKAVLEARERRADVGISAMFVALAVVVIYDASKDLLAHDADRDLIELIILYTPSTLLFFVLGAAKVHVGTCIRSPSLRKDGMCSLAGALMSSGVLVSAVIEELTPIWWFDSVVALIVASGLGVKGGLSLASDAQSGVRWWSAHFWRTGAGGGTAKGDAGDDLHPLLGDL